MKLKHILRMGAAAFGALAIASAAPAGAADLYHNGGGSLKDVPYIPPPLWTGFYIGGHVGGAWSANDNNNNNGQFFTFPDDGATAFFNNNNNNNNQSAVFGGVQFGYNWQGFGSGYGLFGPNWLFGFEVDFGGFGSTNNNNRRLTAVDPVTGNVVSIGQNCGNNGFNGFNNNNNCDQSGIYGDVTGRLGYTWGNTLLYAKGGFAWLTNPNRTLEETTFNPTTGITTFGGIANSNNDSILPGWTVGGGIEYLFSQNWSVKVEYMFFDFSQESDHCCNDGILVGGVPVNNFRFDNDLQYHTVKVGINYIFNQPPPLPLK